MSKVCDDVTGSLGGCDKMMKLYILTIIVLLIVNTVFNKKNHTVQAIVSNAMYILFMTIILIVMCETIPRFTYFLILILILGTIISLYNNIGCMMLQ